MQKVRLGTFAVALGAAVFSFMVSVPSVNGQSISLAPGPATLPPPPPPGPPCFGAVFSPDGDIFDPILAGSIPMGPPGCGLGWFGPPPPMPANVNAFSSGLSPAPTPLPLPPAAASLLFSVDGAATGSGGPFACAAATPALPFAADVNSEAGALPATSDAAADWHIASPNLLAALPGFEPMLHAQFADGDGVAAPPFFLPPLVGAPFGLVEPVPGGDDIDAMDFAPPGAYDFAPPFGVPDLPVYFSVDFATAAAGGIFPADVLVTVGGGPALYAPPVALGLDFFGPATDDIDALVVVDVMGDLFYDPTPATGPDLIYYSLAPGSATIGTFDACLGVAIEEGDMLADGTSIGFPGAPPCVVIPADNIGLWPARACGVNAITGLGGDNLNAADFHPPIIITTTTTTTVTTSTTSTTGGATTTTSTTNTTLAPFCAATPEPDVACRLADASGAGKSSIGMKDKSPDTKDRLKWKWNKGVATVLGDFLSPDTGTATMRVCLYDAGGKLLEMDLPPGGVVPTCGTKPCWKAAGSSGFKYKNKTGAGAGGIIGAKFKAGAAGKAQVQIKTKGKGGFYISPATGSLATDVIVQLLIDDGVTTECFKTAFPGATGTVQKQDAENFKAKGP